MGFVTGSVGGLGAGVKYSLDNNVNLFSGKPNPVMPKPDIKQPNVNYNFETDEYDGKTTLYRGTTGSEQDGGPLFMTNDANYAGSYVKNGGSIQQVTIPNSTLNQMYHNGDYTTFKGYYNVGNSTRPVIAYKFSPQLKLILVPRFQPFNFK